MSAMIRYYVQRNLSTLSCNVVEVFARLLGGLSLVFFLLGILE